MRICKIAILILLGCAAAAVGHSQPIQPKKGIITDNRPLTGEEWCLQLVKRLLSFPSPVTNGYIQLRGMGDEAAVDLLKILGEKSSFTEQESQAALDIVNMAFEKPDSIISAVNRSPSATMFLLQHLESNAKPDVVARVSEVRHAIRSSLATFAGTTQ